MFVLLLHAKYLFYCGSGGGTVRTIGDPVVTVLKKNVDLGNIGFGPWEKEKAAGRTAITLSVVVGGGGGQQANKRHNVTSTASGATTAGDSWQRQGWSCVRSPCIVRKDQQQQQQHFLLLSLAGRRRRRKTISDCASSLSLSLSLQSHIQSSPSFPLVPSSTL